MAIIDKIKAKAKSNVMHIVLPEGDEPRTVKAASIIVEQGLAKLTLLGNPEKIKEVAAGASSRASRSSTPPPARSAPSTPPPCTSCARPRA